MFFNYLSMFLVVYLVNPMGPIEPQQVGFGISVFFSLICVLFH